MQQPEIDLLRRSCERSLTPAFDFKGQLLPALPVALTSEDLSVAALPQARRSRCAAGSRWLRDHLAYAHPGAPVATTEPVADYMLEAAGADNLTSWTFQAANMNGTDPSPQDAAAQKALFTQRKVKAFLYNQQVTDALTQSYLQLARDNGIPVVGVYETMPVPGFTYQSWMLAEVSALDKAVTSKVSTEHL